MSDDRPAGERLSVACAGAVVRREDGRILVVLRRNPPSQGLWSIPGGRVEPAESVRDAAAREVREETGLHVSIGRLLGQVLLPADERHEYDVSDFAADVVGDPDAIAAGDDAADVRWVSQDEFERLAGSPGLAAELRGWGVWS